MRSDRYNTICDHSAFKSTTSGKSIISNTCNTCFHCQTGYLPLIIIPWYRCSIIRRHITGARNCQFTVFIQSPCDIISHSSTGLNTLRSLRICRICPLPVRKHINRNCIRFLFFQRITSLRILLKFFILRYLICDIILFCISIRRCI